MGEETGMDAFTIILAVFILGALIFVHELGHFLEAKRVGVEVITFSIGIGPTLVRVTRGGTEYCVKLIPWAGYVRLRGEEPGEEPAGPGHFEARSPWERARILMAGPFMNLILPFLLMPCVFLLGLRMPAYLNDPPDIGWVSPESPGSRAGLVPGDRILSAGTMSVTTWENLQTEILTRPGKTLPLSVLRNGMTYKETLIVPEAQEGGAGDAGIYPPMEPVVGRVRKGYPAASAGLLPEDRVISINEMPVTHWAQMARVIRQNPGKSVILGIARGGSVLTVRIVPRKDEKAGGGVIGVERKEKTVVRKMGVGQSILEGWEQIGRYSALVFFVLGKLVTGEVSLNSLGGPIAIADFTAQAAKGGFSRLLDFISFISLQLGILNLIPFLTVVDGGQLFLILIETALGRKLGLRKKEIARYVGFALLLTLMALVTVNDIIRIWGDDIIHLYRTIVRALS